MVELRWFNLQFSSAGTAIVASESTQDLARANAVELVRADPSLVVLVVMGYKDIPETE